MKTTLAILTLALSLNLVTPPEVREGGITAPEPVEAVEKVKAVKVAPKAEKAVETVKKAPEPVVAPVRSGNCALVNEYNWPTDVAYGVCMAESGGNSNAINWGDNHGQCSGSYGLMQVGCLHYPQNPSRLLDAEFNMEIAYRLWKSSGFSPWTTYTSQKYLRYL